MFLTVSFLICCCGCLHSLASPHKGVYKNVVGISFIKQNKKTSCAGFAVTKCLILLPAHCVSTFKDDIDSVNITKFVNESVSLHPVFQVEIHPNFTNDHKHYDLAFLKLSVNITDIGVLKNLEEYEPGVSVSIIAFQTDSFTQTSATVTECQDADAPDTIFCSTGKAQGVVVKEEEESLVLLGFSTEGHDPVLNLNLKKHLQWITKRVKSGYEGQKRILYGEKVPLYTYLFMVRIYVKNERSRGWCGGSLIGPRVVLTAAHCAYSGGFLMHYSLLAVQAGGVEWNSVNMIDSDIEFIIPHPEYDDLSMDNDIALFFLTQSYPVSWSVLLAETDYPPSTPVTIMGFGLTEDGQESKVLLSQTTTLTTAEVCYHYWHIVSKGNICTGMLSIDKRRKTSSNAGDSGGPIVVDNNGELIQVALVSYGVQDPVESNVEPSVNTNIPHYLIWIDETIEKYSKEGKDAFAYIVNSTTTPEITFVSLFAIVFIQIQMIL